MKYRNGSALVDAIQWTGSNLQEIVMFASGSNDIKGASIDMPWEDFERQIARDGLKIYTHQGRVDAHIGDWIIKAIDGQHFPLNAEVFAQTYEQLAS